MAETLVGYKERWQKAWRPHWRKWLATKPLRTAYRRQLLYNLDGVLIVPPDEGVEEVPLDAKEIVVKVETLAWGYTEEKAPEPEELASIVNIVLADYIRGGEKIASRLVKPEAAEAMMNVDAYWEQWNWTQTTNRLLIRKPFEVHVERDWPRCEDNLWIYGRFGRVEL